MPRAKVFLSCPHCQSRLDLKKNIGPVGICSFCGWAGSLKSENHDNWVQLKVSFLLVVVGLSLSFMAMQIGQSLKSFSAKNSYQNISTAHPVKPLQKKYIN